MASSNTRIKSRLGICNVCLKENGKYTCPACEIVSCSLTCSKKHKKDEDCDGIRVRTSFVRMENYGNMELLNDYRLLDDISTKVDSCSRNKFVKNHPYHSPQLRFSKLKEAVLKRDASLILLPDQFARHKSNSSMFDFKHKDIKWKIQLTFLNANSFTIFHEKCSDETILSTLMEQYINERREASKSLISRKLNTYSKLGIKKTVVLMKAEGITASNKKFYKLEMGKRLKDNFVGKNIVEFPQFYVLLEGCYSFTKLTRGTNSSDKRSYFITTQNGQKETEIPISSSSDTSDVEDDLMESENAHSLLSQYQDLIKRTSQN